ncbi:MAG: succinyl-diaminopimelate desuccinylase [Pseudomonadota bacterium]
MSEEFDPVDLTRALIRCPSVTPVEGGALDLLEARLNKLGFSCRRMIFEDEGSAPVDNLYARLGTSGPNFCYAGHTDVVPPGDLTAWSVDPFEGTLRDDRVIGRGAVDMKGSIAAFVAACQQYLADQNEPLPGSISLLITGDEEDAAINGTRKVLARLADEGERLDVCLVGEPTSNSNLADMIKIGRRGSLNGVLRVQGTQGHTAYPQLADNAAHHLVRMLGTLTAEELDQGNDYFPPSNLQVTSIDIGNPVSNVIPGQAEARFNVRFNSEYDSQGIVDWVRARLDGEGAAYDLDIRVSGESFLCPPGPWSDLLSGAVKEVTGQDPELGTTGGTSDARFIKDFCSVAELGLLNATAHKVDEQVPVEDLRALTNIYLRILQGYFSSAGP